LLAEPGLPLIPATVIPVEFQRSAGILSRLLGIIVFVGDLIKRTSRIVAMIKITSTAISTDVIIYRREHL